MSKTVIVYTCAHADPSVGNERFDWLGSLIEDVKPDYTVDLGDGADMRSLNSYDTRYPQAIVNQNYEADINSYNDAQSRLWDRYRISKRKRPFRIGFEGNHENRIKKAIAHDPRLEGNRYGVSFSHLQTDHWFDEYHEYVNSGPALVAYDDVLYGHYVATGNYGSAMANKHHACALVEKTACSTTVGHSHKFHHYRKADARPLHLMGLVAGCFKGKEEPWAGQANGEWTSGVAIKKDLENGVYDLEWVSYRRLQRAYQ